jgi:hypothetical protein
VGPRRGSSAETDDLQFKSELCEEIQLNELNITSVANTLVFVPKLNMYIYCRNTLEKNWEKKKHVNIAECLLVTLGKKVTLLSVSLGYSAKLTDVSYRRHLTTFCRERIFAEHWVLGKDVFDESLLMLRVWLSAKTLFV